LLTLHDALSIFFLSLFFIHVKNYVDILKFCVKNSAQQSEAHMNMRELLKSRALLMPLGIAVIMQLSQQLSGM